MLAQQSEQRFANVLLPKVDSSWLIHQHTKNLSLDFFVLFSSATSMLGSPGQANYIAANSFLDSLAHLRKAEGLPATSINWGAWDSIGMAARMNLQDQLAKLGIKTITPNIAHQLLDEILQISPAQIGAFAIDWKVYLGNNNRRAFFNEVVEETDALDPNSANTTQSSFLNEFKAIHQDEHISFIHNHIAKCVAAVLGIPKSRKIDRKQGFFDLGMDSLTSVELKNRLSTDLGMNLPATLAFDHPNINALAEHLLSRLTQLTVAPLDPAQQTREDHTKQVAELSEEEAEETLKRALKEMGFENK
jgi:acyl carrier protein